MNSIWLDLEEFIKARMNDKCNEINYHVFYMVYRIIQIEMERAKSEFYYQSLKEAGYF